MDGLDGAFNDKQTCQVVKLLTSKLVKLSHQMLTAAHPLAAQTKPPRELAARVLNVKWKVLKGNKLNGKFER